MVAWAEFAAEAPQIAEGFLRRHSATHNLCLLATIRSDGYPRSNPLIFECRNGSPGEPNHRV